MNGMVELLVKCTNLDKKQIIKRPRPAEYLFIMEIVNYPKPSFTNRLDRFMLPAKDQTTNLFKFEPRTVKDISNATRYYVVYVINDVVKVDKRDIDKIDFTQEAVRIIL